MAEVITVSALNQYVKTLLDAAFPGWKTSAMLC